jgi:hypothetical protein
MISALPVDGFPGIGAASVIFLVLLFIAVAAVLWPRRKR